MIKRRQLRVLIFCFIVLIGSFFLVPPQQQQYIGDATGVAAGYYAIAYFVDGDTVAVTMNGKSEVIRFIGIDTAETKKPNTPVQCFGPEASAFTKEAIGKKPVRLEADPIGDNRDRYNRLLRYVYLPDGTLLNERLISEGYAFAYLTFPFSKKADFAAAEAKAQEAKLGLWTKCQPEFKNNRWQSNNL